MQPQLSRDCIADVPEDKRPGTAGRGRVPPQGRRVAGRCADKTAQAGTRVRVFWLMNPDGGRIGKSFSRKVDMGSTITSPPHPNPLPPVGGRGDKRKICLRFLKKCSLSKPRGPYHGVDRLESLGHRPGAKALAVERRVLAHYRGRFGELPEKKLSLTRFRERRFSVSLQAILSSDVLSGVRRLGHLIPSTAI